MADWLPPKAPEANTPSVGATPEVLQAGHETRALQLTHAIVNVRATRDPQVGAERNAAPPRRSTASSPQRSLVDCQRRSLLLGTFPEATSSDETRAFYSLVNLPALLLTALPFAFVGRRHRGR